MLCQELEISNMYYLKIFISENDVTSIADLESKLISQAAEYTKNKK